MFLSKGQRKNFKNKRIQHKDAMVQNSTSVVAAVVEWVKIVHLICEKLTLLSIINIKQNKEE